MSGETGPRKEEEVVFPNPLPLQQDGSRPAGMPASLSAKPVESDFQGDSDVDPGEVSAPESDDPSPADTSVEVPLLDGWRRPRSGLSLEEVHSSVPMPGPNAGWGAKMLVFAGVGFMVSVGYMDPGNWATDLQGGASFGYRLLCVILLSNFAAMFLQALSLKLGVVAERDLAQACRDAYPKWVVYILWLMAEVAIAATDLAEIIGSATALNLLTGMPLWAGVLITACDVFFLLLFGMKNFRVLELIVFLLCTTIAACFVYELAAASPDWAQVAKGLIPQPSILTHADQLFVAIGILGATVMPHNLYLHSSIIQTRAYPRDEAGKRTAVKYGTIDSTLSLSVAFFINAAILILAASAFHYGPNANPALASISEAYKLLSPAVGASAAKTVFAIALLASGQNSTITGTLSGQIVMEGFLQIKLKPWLRRIITRGVAIIPAAIVAGISGNAGAGRLLVLSQVILSLALSFAVIPLVHFTSSRAKMGKFVNGWVATIAAWLLAAIIAGLNGYLIVDSIRTNQFGTAGAV